MHRTLPCLLSSLALALSLTGCGDDGGGPSEPDHAICLYESAVCSIGEYGTGCPPGAADYTTECIDTETNFCVQAGQDSEYDSELGTTYYFYTQNPRLVQGVTCEDYSTMPELDPDPPTPTCAYENDGTCDAPGTCPAGTDVADCSVPTCEQIDPDPADCNAGAQDALWCTNTDGGDTCSEGADIYFCDAGTWVRASDAATTQACQDSGYTSYYGCAGTFDATTVYCE